MVKHRDDVDGCGCIRCQGVDPAVVRRSLPGTLQWSGGLVREQPSIVAVFLGIALVQTITLSGPPWLVLVGVLFGLSGVFLGRGYVGVLGRDRLVGREPDPVSTLLTVLSRFPAFVGAGALVALLFSIAGVIITRGLSVPVRRLFVAVGLSQFLGDVALLVVLAATLLYGLLKFWFVPEACFIGGYGPLSALKISWHLTSVHRRKAAVIAVGFVCLLAVGVVLDAQIGESTSLVTLSVQVGDTAVRLRSFGLPTGRFRLAFDLLVTAFYSGVFAHQYVAGIFESAG